MNYLKMMYIYIYVKNTLQNQKKNEKKNLLNFCQLHKEVRNSIIIAEVIAGC